MSFTSAAEKATSRLYQDLANCLASVQSSTDSNTKELIKDVFQKSRTNPSMSSSPKICVVGAGVSGLRCADILLRHGFSVTLIEARNRIGGRLHQTTMPSSGHLIDTGPNWIHGTDHNPILDIALKTQTGTHEFKDQEQFFDENGEALESANMMSYAMWEIIEEGFKFSRENTSTIGREESLYGWFKGEVERRFEGEGEVEKKKILMQMIHFWGAFVASKVETQSLKFLWMEEVIGGQNLFCAETYQKVLNYIAQPALDGCKLMFETKVTKIDTSGLQVSVFTESGEEMRFDEVVFTVPLGWLKKNAAATFTPPLLDRTLQAISNIGYGNLEKVYITFPRAFWLGAEDAPDSEQFTGIFQWLAPSYAGDYNPEEWNQEALDLSTLTISPHPTLLFYIFGPQASFLSSTLSILPPSSHSSYLISHFLPYISKLPYYLAEKKECQATEALFTDWTSDDLAGNGSYTTMLTGSVEADRDIEVLREGCPGRGLWFAGEHTAPFIAYGTVTGAYWSGEHVGERIAKSYEGKTGEVRAETEGKIDRMSERDVGEVMGERVGEDCT